MIRASLHEIALAAESAFGPMNFVAARDSVSKHQRLTVIHAMKRFGWPKPSSVSIARALGIGSHGTVLNFLALPVDEADLNKIASFLPDVQYRDAKEDTTLRDVLIEVVRTSTHPALNKRVRK